VIPEFDHNIQYVLWDYIKISIYNPSYRRTE